MHQEDKSHSDIFSDLEELQLIIQTLCPLFKNIEAAMTNQWEKKTPGPWEQGSRCKEATPLCLCWESTGLWGPAAFRP